MKVEREERNGEQMAVIIRRILADSDGPLTFEELHDRIESEIQEGMRHLSFNGEIEKNDRIDRVAKREYSLSDLASKEEGETDE